MKISKNKVIAACLTSFCLTLLTVFLHREIATHKYPVHSQANEVDALAATVEQSTSPLLESSKSYSLGDELQKDLVNLASERAAAMRELMLLEPERALEASFSHSDYELLPKEIQEIVERPFTQIAKYDMLAICHSDSHHNDTHHYLTDPVGNRSVVSPSLSNRLTLAKENVPVQGITLDAITVLHPQVFQPVSGSELEWAQSRLPLANPNQGRDFLTDQPITGSGEYAISGGYLFRFDNEESLQAAEEEFAHFDSRPGLQLGTPALLAKLKEDPASFSTSEFLASQQQFEQALVTQTRNVLIIRVDFPDVTGTPFEKTEIEDLINNKVAPTFADYSYNKSTVEATASESSFRLSNSSEYSDTNKLYDDAIEAYIAGGNQDPKNQYIHIAVSFPNLGFDWAGLASIGGKAQWLQGRVNPSTIVHELGHNYGLSHASYWDHGDSQDPVDAAGSTVEYGDDFDVMGDGNYETGHFHMAAKQFLGWIENSEWSELSTTNDNGTYRVYAFDDVSANGLQALKIRKSGNDGYYWLGLRQNYPGLPYFNKGAYLVWARPGSENNRSWLVDTTPNSASGKLDAGIAVGRTYSDAAAGVHITPLEHGVNSTGAYLDVSVNLGDFSNNQAPSGTLTASTSGTARTAIPFSFSGTDPNNDELSYHWDFGDGTVELSQASVDHEFPVGGSYTLTLTVSDRKGGTFIQQAQIEIFDPITQITVRESGVNNHLRALATNGSRVIAAGSGGAFLRSDDGAQWSNESFFNKSNLSINQIIWTGEEFFAVGGDYDFELEGWVGVVFTSSNGETWTQVLRSPELVGSWGFLSVARDPVSETTVIVQSDAKVRVGDAEGNWSIVDLGMEQDAWSNAASVIWDGNSFVVGGYDFSQTDLNQRLVIFKSPDGSEWTRIEATDSGLLGWYGLRDLAFVGDRIIGSGFGAGLVYSNDSGETWSNNHPNSEYRAHAFAYGNGIFSAHGSIADSDSQDFLSSDGRTWQPAGDPQSEFNDRIFFANTFISVGNSGLIVQSDEFSAPSASPFQSWIVGYTTDSTEQSALANPDSDWAPNFLEYALGSDPTDGTSVPKAPTLHQNADGTLVISISRFEKTDVELNVEKSIDLESWTPLAGSITADTELLLEITSATPLADSQSLFLRVKASQ